MSSYCYIALSWRGCCSISDVKFGFVKVCTVSFSYLLANFFPNSMTINLWFVFARSVFRAKCLEVSKILHNGWMTQAEI
jgi:hypothetical protein